MKDSRFDQLKELIPKDLKEKFTGIVDGRYGEDKILYSRADGLTPENVEEIKKSGFIVISPELPNNPTVQEQWMHENSFMILDKVEPGKNSPTEVLTAVNAFYNQFNKNKISCMRGDGSIKQFASPGLEEIYNKTGIQYEKDGEDLIVKSSFEKPTRPKNVFSKIWQNTKGKMGKAFENFRNFVKGDKTRGIEAPQQENEGR